MTGFLGSFAAIALLLFVLKSAGIEIRPKTNMNPENTGHRKLVFQSSIFRCDLLVSGMVLGWLFSCFFYMLLHPPLFGKIVNFFSHLESSPMFQAS